MVEQINKFVLPITESRFRQTWGGGLSLPHLSSTRAIESVGRWRQKSRPAFDAGAWLTGSNESLATLKLLNLTERSNGKYKCEASNAFGKAEYEFVLKVKGEFDSKFI